ncbi:MAG: hypothetical protein ACR2OZ_02640 [Verrucomicrobiales bacterium]
MKILSMRVPRRRAVASFWWLTLPLIVFWRPAAGNAVPGPAMSNSEEEPVSLAAALDQPFGLADWRTRPSDASEALQWRGDTAVSHDGVDAARASVVSETLTYLAATVTAVDSLGTPRPGLLSFWFRIDGSPAAGYVLLNGTVLATISSSGEAGTWHHVTAQVSDGFAFGGDTGRVVSISLAVPANASGEAFVDEVAFEPLPSISERASEALDIPLQRFFGESTASPPGPELRPPVSFVLLPEGGHEAGDGLQLPDLCPGGSWLSTNVIGPSKAKFWYRTTENPGFRVSVGDWADYLPAAAEWTEKEIQIPKGTHTISWQIEQCDVSKSGSAVLDALTIEPVPMVNLTSVSSVYGRAGEAISSFVLATDPPAERFSVDQLPGGFALNETTGTVSGAALGPSHTTVIFRAHLGVGSIDIPINWRIWPELSGKAEADLNFSTSVVIDAVYTTLVTDGERFLGWVGENDAAQSHDGVDCLRSRPPGRYDTFLHQYGSRYADWYEEERRLRAMVNLSRPTQLSFWWRVSGGGFPYQGYPAPAGVDWAGLFANSVYVPAYLGVRNQWRAKSLNLPAGTHTLDWLFIHKETTGITNKSDDTLFLDEIKLAPIYSSKWEWAGLHGLPSPLDEAFWLSDPDLDGATHLEEYVLGGNPVKADRTNLPVPKPASTGEWEVQIVLASGHHEVEVTPEIAIDNLTTWSSSDLLWSIADDVLIIRVASSRSRTWLYRLRMTMKETPAN